ncbi:MAG: hypothetical protein AMJ46_06830 [Latescibacteria bacterium DG_63]|nr:MAG: hypothetical protein AMJ46_06830 [Latescibacteria bacterium DG_63]
MRLIKETHVPFLRYRRKAYVFSIILIVAGVASLVLRGGPNYGIDFTGGALMQLHFDKPITTEDIRGALAKVGLERAVIQRLGGTDDFVIQMKGSEEEGIANLVVATLQENFPDNTLRVDRQEEVGPKIGKELQRRALLVVLAGMLVILGYIAFRFDFRFAVGSVVALVHDVVITVGILSMLNREMTIAIIAALLTVVGYSVNDSIIISDRIRENRKLMRGEPFDKIVNTGLNDTLSRTVMTGLTTILVLLSILIFGGEVIFDFALTLLIGVIVGTYSSIFIVAALVVEWVSRKQ